MALSTYPDLQAAIASWNHRSGDTEFEALTADFIRLAEARFNRILRVRQMEQSLSSIALSSGEVSLPSGFLAFKELRFDGDDDYTLQPKALEWIRAQDATNAGNAQYFAITKTAVVCWPPNGSIKGTYYEEIPALADNETNWLLDGHPDLYLFASLVESVLWTQDDSRIPLWAEKASALLDAVQRESDRDEFDGGVLAIRAR